ncbi:hypothetical protein AB6A40_005752 [Gnathostoma spinigerum]|uniref:Anaphase-promoting complex subunit 4-like WD40 domain-containing protein n=1 Tax=Gnathostoma spinigerum TaxID=75299 RepID=A0ABD6EGC4_9BILA
MATENEYERIATFASLPRTTRGLPLVLGASPDGKKYVYCNGNSVFIRSIEHPSDCDIYTEHSTATTVAKFSPSGYYIASADQSGKVRIWDTTQSTHILKSEFAVISGAIRDIAWSEDSKRVAVVGDGRERFGHVFLFDTGTSNGNLSGQSRPMSSIDFRPARPYRLISGSEDNTVAIFEGPPFKFKSLFYEHTRFVHCVRYNSKGSLFASGGADCRLILYEGVEGGKTGQFIDPNCKQCAHDGGIFSICWSPDDMFIASASGDKTVKVWNVSTLSLERTFSFGTAIEDQQLAVLWTKCGLISVSLSGFVNYLDFDNSKIASVVHGHNKPVTAIAVTPDKNYVFTADFEGHITRWQLPKGNTVRLTPAIHKSQVSGLVCLSSGELVSVGWDDTVAFSSAVTDECNPVHSTTIKLTSQPRGVASSADGNVVAVACQKNITIILKRSEVRDNPIKFEASCISLCSECGTIAVGSQDCKVRIYNLGGGNLVEIKSLEHSGAITSVAWSPDGKYLVATDASRKVVPYSVENDFAVASDKAWTFHSARVNCSSWSDNSRYVATGGIDTNVIIWDVKQSDEHPLIIQGAHATSPINGVVWTSSDSVLSAGQDSVLKIWKMRVL